MRATPSNDRSPPTWWDALIFVVGLLLIVSGGGWFSQRPPTWGWVTMGILVAGWGWRSGGWRWLTEAPGTVLAYLLGGGNPQARRYGARLTSEALVYSLFMVVLLLGGLLGHSNMLLLVFALLAGSLVLNGYATILVLRQVRGRRTLPDMVFAGEPFSIQIELTNRKRWLSSWLLQVEDHLRQGSHEHHPTVLFERIPPHSSRFASYQVAAPARGVLDFLSLRISSRYPLGLWERGFELNLAEQLLILPRVGRLTGRFREALRTQQRTQFDAPARTGVFDEEFHRLREFRPGDSRRAIHWRTTARRNELMVREYQEQHDPEWLLLVDLWLPPQPGATDLERLETVISFVASCCTSRARTGRNTGLQLSLCGRQFASLGEPGQGLTLRDALESLALAEGSSSPATGHLADILEQRRGESSRKLFISSHPDSQNRLEDLLAGLGLSIDEVGSEFECPASEGVTLEDLFELDPLPGLEAVR
ncbi:MAG: DUF58 domain-containing protein [Planctomycetaceae bacterium]